MPASPSASEASEVFFSPSESLIDGEGGVPAHVTPSLSGLLDADEELEAGVPALSALLQQDAEERAAQQGDFPLALPPDDAVDDATMDMTRVVGGILGRPLLPAAEAAAAGGGGDDADDDADGDDAPSMDMTAAVGGILAASAASALAPAPLTAATTPLAAATTTPLAAPTPSGESGAAALLESPLVPSSDAPPPLSGGGGSVGAATPAWLRSAAAIMGEPTPVAAPALAAEEDDDDDDDDGAMELTGVVHAPPAPFAAMEPDAPSPPPPAPPPPPPEAAEASGGGGFLGMASRRKSLSQKVAEVSSRVWRSFAASSEAVDEAPPPPPPPADPAAPPPPPAAEAEEAEAEAEAEEALAEGGGVMSFDEYLAASGIRFLDARGSASRQSLAKGLGALVPTLNVAALDDDAAAAAEGRQELVESLTSACVVEPHVEQLKWAAGELIKCIGVLQSGYDAMEEYVASEYPGFFAAAENQLPPADLKRLKSRCRQTARALWYDWRQTLEEDSAKKLEAAMAHLASDVRTLRELEAAADAAQEAIRAAMPPPTVAEEAAAAAVGSRDAANALALQQTAVSRAESSQMALQQQLISAEKEVSCAPAGPEERPEESRGTGGSTRPGDG